MTSVDSSRVKKKYVVTALRGFTPNSPNDESSHQYGTLYSGLWVSGQLDGSASPAYFPFDNIADALSYANELNNNRVEPVPGSPTYNSPSGGPGIASGHESDDGFTYYWGVTEVWVIDPAVDPS